MEADPVEAAVQPPPPQQQNSQEQQVNNVVGDGEEGVDVLRPSFPVGRVKKIIKLDQEIKKVNSEALLLVALSAELFLESFAERARDAAAQRKRRAVKAAHLWHAAVDHQPTADFLLDCLHQPEEQSKAAKKKKSAAQLPEKPLPPATRRIDEFFCKPSDVKAASLDGDQNEDASCMAKFANQLLAADMAVSDQELISKCGINMQKPYVA